MRTGLYSPGWHGRIHRTPELENHLLPAAQEHHVPVSYHLVSWPHPGPSYLVLLAVSAFSLFSTALLLFVVLGCLIALAFCLPFVCALRPCCTLRLPPGTGVQVRLSVGYLEFSTWYQGCRVGAGQLQPLRHRPVGATEHRLLGFEPLTEDVLGLRWPGPQQRIYCAGEV